MNFSAALLGRRDRRKSQVVNAAGDASEDGDFVALRESREGRSAEVLSPRLSTIVEQPVDINRPLSPREQLPTGKGRARSAGVKRSPWAEVEDAAASGPEAFRECLNRLNSSPGLTHKSIRNPRGDHNVLHLALASGNDELINVVSGLATEELICAEFEFDVGKISGKKTALHQCVDLGRLDLLKQLLFKISGPKTRQKLLNRETPVEIQGQRPRTFPCLHLAAYHGHLDIVTFLIDEAGVAVNGLNAKKDSALLWAARWGHVAVVRELLARGARPGLENDKGSTALYWAVRYGHTETVQVLASEGKADVNQTRKLGLVAPIVLASALGLEDIVTILLQYGADANKSIRGGERPIHHAAREGFSNIVKLLISHDAAVDAADERGDTALLLAAKYGRAMALHTLLEFGANVNHKNLLGEDVWSFSVASDNDLILRLLVLHQSSEGLEDTDDDGDAGSPGSMSGVNSVLHLAAAAGNTERIKLLLKMKVDAKATDDNGNNILHIAAMKNQADVIAQLHQLVGVDQVNKTGDTPLHFACERGHHEVILELINLKAMANIRNENGETALHVAAYSRLIQPTTVSRIMEYVIKTHPWECLNIQDNEGNNPLHIAAKFAKPEVLWEFRFVRFKDPDADGNIALHEAVRHGEPEVFDMMLDIFDAMKRDCDINHQNKINKTALHLAAEAGFLEGVNRLILFGADISMTDLQGNTVLHLLTTLTVTAPSRCARYVEIIQAILDRAPQWYCSANKLDYQESRGEEENPIRRMAILHLISGLQTKAGVTVLDLACKVGACEVIQLLVTMDEVMAFKVGKRIRYDVTNMIPRTNGNLKGWLTSGGTVSPRPSCLEWLLSKGERAAPVLDLQPFSEIEKAYGSLAAWTYGLVLLLHIIYMTVFTWAGLTLLAKSRNHPGDRDIDTATMMTFIFVQVEPIVIVIYYLYSLVKLCCLGEMVITAKLAGGGVLAMFDAYLYVIRGVIFAVSVIAWTIAYAENYKYMDYFLAVSLCLGWLFSIIYLRGFKFMNYFWRLIKMMVMRDVTKFLFVFLFVLLGFGFAFHTLFQASPSVINLYPNPASTLFLMFNMLIGQDYVFETGEVEAGLSAADRSSLYLKKQTVVWRIESVQLGVDIEKTFPSTFPVFSKIKVTKGFICPADRDRQMQRWYIEVTPSTVTEPVDLDEAEDAFEEKLDRLATKMAALETKVGEQTQALQANLDDVHTTLKRLEQALVKPSK
ncbi:ankyrin-1 [Plakobranchus ocellatus]|uniref:Ankyrin-1 n=1 Tax=Plakobranchus ocellatus TaxID=259542 RepID=A0AAV4CFE4_9GAST|nr:ankyrin-1 [Plakobranchus ocellatus]